MSYHSPAPSDSASKYRDLVPETLPGNSFVRYNRYDLTIILNFKIIYKIRYVIF